MKTSIKEISLRVTDLEGIFKDFLIKIKQDYNIADIFYSDTTFEEFIRSFEYVMWILKFLIKSHKLFLTISTESERNNILNNPNNLTPSISQWFSHANNMIIYTDNLKTIIR